MTNFFQVFSSPPDRFAFATDLSFCSSDGERKVLRLRFLETRVDRLLPRLNAIVAPRVVTLLQYEQWRTSPRLLAGRYILSSDTLTRLAGTCRLMCGGGNEHVLFLSAGMTRQQATIIPGFLEAHGVSQVSQSGLALPPAASLGRCLLGDVKRHQLPSSW
jgi:hypothetical protein